jgi:hypothetical protein
VSLKFCLVVVTKQQQPLKFFGVAELGYEIKKSKK